MAHTVMVTGADGFIGSHLTEELVKRGEKVRAFCLYNSFGSLGWIDTLPPEIRSEIDIFMGDVRDPNGVRTAMRGQERVFHLAALIAIPFSYHSPDSYVDTNIKGTLNVLNAARELDTQRVLVTSTSEVYGTAQYVPIDEKHPFQGQSPYSATKIGADRLAESFYRSFDLPVTIGCEQLKKFPTFIERRRHNWDRLRAALQPAADKLILPEPAANSRPSWFGFLISVKPESGLDRNAVTRYVESHNVQTRLLFSGNLIKHPCFDQIRGTDAYRVAGELTNTDFIMNNTFWVGVYPGMTDEMIDYMAKTIIEAVNQ